MGERVVLVAEVDGEMAGYVTLVWESEYLPFRAEGIPEIQDSNVFFKFRRQGIGASLLQEIERRAATRSPVVGLGVGLTADYGAAQILYVRRGYVPDGKGLSQRNYAPRYGEQVQVDDDLVLYLTKQVRIDQQALRAK